MRERGGKNEGGGDSRYSHSSPIPMTNDNVAPDCFRTWAVVFVHGRLVSCMSLRFRAWATVFMRGPSFSCVGDWFRAWVTTLVRGNCLCVRRSFSFVGGWLGAWVVVGVGGVVVACGVVVLWFSWNDSGRVGGAYHVEEQRRTTNGHSSFVVRLPHHRQ